MSQKVKKAKVVKKNSSVKETFMFLLQSLYKNTVCLEQEQKWWLALIMLILSLFASVLGSFTVTYLGNASAIASTSNGDTGLDVGMQEFADDLNDNSGDSLKIISYRTEGTGKFVPQTLNIADNFASLSETEKKAAVENYTYNAAYIHKSNGVVYPVLRVYVLDVDTLGDKNKDNESAFLNAFVNYAVKNSDAAHNPWRADIPTTASSESTSSSETSENTRAPEWVASSYLLITRSVIQVSTFIPNGSSVTTMQGYLTRFENYDFASLAKGSNGTVIADSSAILNNFVSFMNEAFYPLKLQQCWINLGMNMGINAGIILIAALILWLVSRSKSAVIHLSFWKALKATVFMSFTPALITFAVSFFMQQYAVFAFMLILALRIMTATNRIVGNGSNNSDSQPVYKARS